MHVINESRELNRRDFLKAAVATGVIVGSGAAAWSVESKDGMPYRALGRTGEMVSMIGLGGYHIGVPKDEREGIQIIRQAVDHGINFMDNCWDYHAGDSEVRMGKALQDGYRAKVFLMSKIDGRTKASAARQIDESLKRLQTDHVDLMQFHEIIRMEDPDRLFTEGAMEAMLEAKKAGKVRYIGFSGYPMKIFRFILDQTDVDCVLSYNQYTLQNTRFAEEIVPYLQMKGVGAMNAGPFSARLLTNAPLPAWLKEPGNVRTAARKAAGHCASRGVDIARLALQFSLAKPGIATTVSGSANPHNIRNWARWAAEPLDEQLLAEVLAIFAPVKNIGHAEGLPENN